MSVIERPQFSQGHLLADFHIHERFHAMIHEASSGSLDPQGRSRITFQRLSGRIFEEVGFLSFLRTMGPTDIFLNPEETTAYFAEIYPERVQAFDNSLQPGLLDWYTPDSVLGKWNSRGGSTVVELVEFTSTKSEKLPPMIAKKIVLFLDLRARHPELFRRTKLHMVISANAELAPDFVETLPSFFKFSRLPITSRELADYTEWVALDNFGLTREEERALAK